MRIFGDGRTTTTTTIYPAVGSTEVENTFEHFGHFGPTLTSFLRVKEWKYQKILKNVRCR